MNYKHLSLEERHYIEISMKNEKTLTEIATELGRSQSSISREILRNTGQRGYRHQQANRMVQERYISKDKSIKLTNQIKSIIDKYIRSDWSPEQIAGRLNIDGIVHLHHETIYQYLLADKASGGDLYTHLRHQNKTYRNAMIAVVTVQEYPIKWTLVNAQIQPTIVNELAIATLPVY